MKKRILALTVALCMVVAMLPMFAGAATYTYSYTTTFTSGSSSYTQSVYSNYTGTSSKTGYLSSAAVSSTEYYAASAMSSGVNTYSKQQIMWITPAALVDATGGDWSYNTGSGYITFYRTNNPSYYVTATYLAAASGTGTQAAQYKISTNLTSDQYVGITGISASAASLVYVPATLIIPLMNSVNSYTPNVTGYPSVCSISGGTISYYRYASDTTIDNGVGYTVYSDGRIGITSYKGLEYLRDQVASGNTFSGKYVYLANDITMPTATYNYSTSGVWSLAGTTNSDTTGSVYYDTSSTTSTSTNIPAGQSYYSQTNGNYICYYYATTGVYYLPLTGKYYSIAPTAYGFTSFTGTTNAWTAMGTWTSTSGTVNVVMSQNNGTIEGSITPSGYPYYAQTNSTYGYGTCYAVVIGTVPYYYYNNMFYLTVPTGFTAYTSSSYTGTWLNGGTDYSSNATYTVLNSASGTVTTTFNPYGLSYYYYTSSYGTCYYYPSYGYYRMINMGTTSVMYNYAPTAYGVPTFYTSTTTTGSYNFTPIGTSTYSFLGTLDGNGKTISGLVMYSSSDAVALFNNIGSGATVKNMTISSATVTGAAGSAILAVSNSGTVDTVSVSGTVSGGTAGLVGTNSSTITSSKTSATVTSESVEKVGGVAGTNSGTIKATTNSGSITGYKYVGGIVGSNSGIVTDCDNSGSVTTKNDYAGGIVGTNSSSGELKDCDNTGSVKATTYAGGVIGQNYGKYTDCTYKNGTADDYVGEENGEVARTDTTIENTKYGISVTAYIPEKSKLNAAAVTASSVRSDLAKELINSADYIEAYNTTIIYGDKEVTFDSTLPYITSISRASAKVTFDVGSTSGDVVVNHVITRFVTLDGKTWTGRRYYTTSGGNNWEETLDYVSDLKAGKVVVMEERTATGSRITADRIEMQLATVSGGKATAGVNSMGIFVLTKLGDSEPVWSNASAWAEAELKQAQNANLIPNAIKGLDFTQNMTRAEMAAITVSMYESLSGKTIAVPTGNPFIDTSATDVLKAYSMGFVAGTSSNTFSPNDNLTREQASCMLARVIKKIMYPDWTLLTDSKYPLTITTTSKFSDDAKIHSWARESVYYMNQEEYVVGNGGSFMPQNNMTRQEAVCIAVRIKLEQK